jgi:hypothetical protein
MSRPSTNPEPPRKRQRQLVWAPTFFLVTVGLLAVARRTYVLLHPSQATPRFAVAAAMDARFAQHKTLTLLHILLASLLVSLMPWQFVRRIRAQHLAWHRWSGRLLLLLGLLVGLSALVMSYTMMIGGTSETAATTLYAILLLVFLGLGFWNIRQRRIIQHREWMIRAFGVALGAATTRPIVGAFFATGRFSPHEFFGTAFWLGFTFTLLGAEVWIHYSREQPNTLGNQA